LEPFPYEEAHFQHKKMQPQPKNELHQRIREAEKKIKELQQEFAQKGYTKAVTYLENARGHFFNHLHLWLETGIIAPHTTSIVENNKRTCSPIKEDRLELVR
jgi:capsule polysaccharide export protein KpsE/RkpR